MKTPFGKEDLSIEELLKNINPNILRLAKKKNECLDYLYKEDRIIPIKLEKQYSSVSYYYNLDILLLDKTFINFTYDFPFLKYAYEFLTGKINDRLSDKSIIPIIIKIINDLIYNYEQSCENIICEAELYNMKKDLNNRYKTFLEKHPDLVEDFELPNKLEELNIEDIYSQIIKNLFENVHFEDFENVNLAIYNFEIDSKYIDKKTIAEIKEMIYSYYTNEFLLTMDDFNDLVGNESKGSNNFQKKINFLFLLMVHILNEPSDLKNFQFLSKTKTLLDEIFLNLEKNKLLSKIDKGDRKRFEQVLNIFDEHKDLFDNEVETAIHSSYGDKLIIKLIEKKVNEPLKNEVGKADILKPIEISKYFDIKIHKKEFVYNFSALKLYENINACSSDEKTSSSNVEDYINTVEYLIDNYHREQNEKPYSEYYDNSIIKEINLIENLKQNYINYILNLLNNLKYIPKELYNNIDYKALIKSEINSLTIIIRNEEMVYSFALAILDNILTAIKTIPNFCIYYEYK